MSDPGLSLVELPGDFAICTLPADAPIPGWADGPPFATISRTPDELSILCPAARAPVDVPREAGWVCLQVRGPFAFTVTGVLAALTGALAAAAIPCLAVAAFQTDYLLVQRADYPAAVAALTGAGHTVAAI